MQYKMAHQHKKTKHDKARPPVVLGNGGPKGYKGKTYEGLEYVNKKNGQRWIYHHKKWVNIPTLRGDTGSTGSTGPTGSTRTISSAMFSVQSRANPQIYSSVGTTGVYDPPGTPYGTFNSLPITNVGLTGSFNPATGIFTAGYTGAYQFNAAGQILVNGTATTPTLSLYVDPVGGTGPILFDQVQINVNGPYAETANISLSTIMAMNMGDQAYIKFSDYSPSAIENSNYNVTVAYFSCSYVGVV